MTKSIEKVATLLVKWLMPFCLLTCVPLLSSCEEDDDDDGEDAEAFPIADVEKFAQVPVDQAPDQTIDGYSADNIGEE